MVRLPGSVPYDNFRPINVPVRFDRQTLLECVCGMHPHVSPVQWRSWFQQGHILRGVEPMSMSQIVRGGQQYRHLFPDTVEPDVDAGIEILWEDDALIAVNKPAPLPVHPCGRFNLNTLTSLLSHVYQPDDLRVVHRLDANTTGVMLLARTVDAATNLRIQFQENAIQKTYLVRSDGHPASEHFCCTDPIAKHRSQAGSREIDPQGHPASTEFRVLRRSGEGSALLQARPLTGRTNQIRIHLWGLGMPVLGDPAYLKGKQRAASQTLRVDQPPMCLHASRLSLIHPLSGEPMQFSSPNPAWIDQPDQET
jgi:RluA family pseudouridine synthase